MAAVSVKYVIPPRQRPVEPQNNPNAGPPLALYRPRPESNDANGTNPSDGISSFNYEEWLWKYKDIIYDRTI